MLPLAPFVIGSMAPDFEYLLRLEPYALVSHSAVGLVTFCLPAGLAFFVLWRALLQPVARALVALPNGADRLPRTTGGWGAVLLALLVGSATHVGWDAMTHRDALGPALFPVLRTTAFAVGSYVVPWYNALQLASSLVGGGIVLAWLHGRVQGGGEGWRALGAPWRLRGWGMVALAAIAVGGWNAPRRGLMSGVAEVKLVLGRFVVGALVGALVGLAALALLQRRGRFPSGARPDDSPGGQHGR